MTGTISRRAFLSGQIHGDKQSYRPPWSLNESEFLSLCSRCLECLNACPEHILITDRRGFPAIDFNKGECTFCAACANACSTAALTKPVDNPCRRPPASWNLVAVVADNCVARTGVGCSICVDQCPNAAISCMPVAGMAYLPAIDHGACHGCGACVGPCPVDAVSLKKMTQVTAGYLTAGEAACI